MVISWQKKGLKKENDYSAQKPCTGGTPDRAYSGGGMEGGGLRQKITVMREREREHKKNPAISIGYSHLKEGATRLSTHKFQYQQEQCSQIPVWPTWSE
ncbi:hypothetical protein [uncultured Bilophila sp.]|uniref:hypothetical protein n=1 Tax=uncultured Bilophila sp. TaxID=529385 RepID=UPI0025DF2F98|nr:hypothetical protein [uncultured Bilophila sp.]